MKSAEVLNILALSLAVANCSVSNDKSPVHAKDSGVTLQAFADSIELLDANGALASALAPEGIVGDQQETVVSEDEGDAFELISKDDVKLCETQEDCSFESLRTTTYNFLMKWLPLGRFDAESAPATQDPTSNEAMEQDNALKADLGLESANDEDTLPGLDASDTKERA